MNNNKKLLLAIPEHMYKLIEQLQPEVASTITGTIITMLEHGINYEFKKRIQNKKRKEQLGLTVSEAATVDQEDYKTDMAKKASMPIRDYFNSNEEYEIAYERWVKRWSKN